jgi:cytochrome bd-type quinol oxidase subunit 1
MNTRKVNEFKIMALVAVFFAVIMSIQSFRLYRQSNTQPLPEENPDFYLGVCIGFLILCCLAVAGLIQQKRSIVFLTLGFSVMLLLVEIFYL